MRSLESKSENNMTDTHCIRVAKNAVVSLPPKNKKNAPGMSVKDDLFHLNVNW